MTKDQCKKLPDYIRECAARLPDYIGCANYPLTASYCIADVRRRLQSVANALEDADVDWKGWEKGIEF